MDSDDQVRYSAELGSLPPSGPPGNPPITRARDVLVLAGDAEVDQGERDDLILLPRWEGATPFAGEWKDAPAIDLGEGLRLEKLPQEEAELVMNACSPRGHYFVPVRQFGQMYSFVADVPMDQIEEHQWSWNKDGRISDGVTMSRLVLDNGYSYEYAARLFDHEGGGQHVMPASVLPRAYRVRKARDWLRTNEAEELAGLVAVYRSVQEDLGDRVAHALWLAEYVVSVRWLDVIAPLLVVAFEALINTSKSLVTRQFKERVSALTEEVGQPLTKSRCESIYDARSRWIHGRRVPRRASTVGGLAAGGGP
jgi:hypothetical protein